MAERWFYTRDGKTHGPFTVEELKRLAAQGVLAANDLLWPEGSEPQVELVPLTPIQPTSASAPPPAPSAIPPSPPGEKPEWLSDVELVAEPALKPQAQPKPQPQPPPKPKPQAQPKPQPQPPKKTGVPDWLDDVRRGEQ